MVETAEGREMMDTVESRDGTSIAFDCAGNGPALVLVGGAFQARAGDPRTAMLIEHLSGSFTVYNYDRRGRGDSGDTAPYSVEREIEDLDALVSEAGGSASAFGMSSGCVLLLDAAAVGVGLTKLGLYEPPLVVDGSRPPVPPDYVETLDRLIDAERRGDAVAYFMTTAVGLPVEMVSGMRSEPFWPAMEALAHTLPYDGRLMADVMSGKPLPKERWSSVSATTLVMDGSESPPYQHAAAEAVANILSNARRRTLDGQTHDVAPDVLAPVLVEFFGGDPR
jgi:Alpha/beta hydrolase family